MKSIKVVCAHSTLVTFFTTNRLYKAKLDEQAGQIVIKDDYGVKHVILTDTMRLLGEESGGAQLEARFVTLKTKTILCTHVDHRAQIKKHFTKGKRYQIMQMRELGSGAGFVFDEDGDRWNLSREDVGFSPGSGIYLFEALYR